MLGKSERESGGGWEGGEGVLCICPRAICFCLVSTWIEEVYFLLDEGGGLGRFKRRKCVLAGVTGVA